MSRRLPLAGALPSRESGDDLEGILPEGEREPLPLPTLTLVDATPGAGAEPLGRELVTALCHRGVRARLLDEAEIEKRGVGPCFAALDDEEVVVALGHRLLGGHAPALALLLTGGRSPIAWSAQARALRGRFDGELSGYRPAFALALADIWAAHRKRDAPDMSRPS